MCSIVEGPNDHCTKSAHLQAPMGSFLRGFSQLRANSRTLDPYGTVESLQSETKAGGAQANSKEFQPFAASSSC